MSGTQNTAIVIAPKHTDTPAWALRYPCWITWTTTQLKTDGSGRYDKVPTSVSGHNCNAHDLKNHRQVTEVLAQYRRTHGTPESLLFEQATGKIAGIALDLPNAPTPFTVTDDGAPRYLIALDFDSVKGNPVNQTKLKAALALLPHKYLEISPSGTGLRVLVLCRVLVAAFNQVGFEVYSHGRFMTMTLRGLGEPSEVAVEVIDQIKALYPREKTAASAPPPENVSSRFDAGDLSINDDVLGSHPCEAPDPERAKSALAMLDSPRDRNEWMRLGFAFRAAGGRFEDFVAHSDPGSESKAQKIWDAFDPDREGGITERTLYRLALDAGWQPPIYEIAVAADGCVEQAGPSETRYKLLSAADLRALPPLAWRVRGVLPAVGQAALFGPSASGKSFLAMDMAAAIAEGQSWFGCRVEAAPVVYAALEGEAGFKLRAQAWEVSRGRELPDGLLMMMQGFKLTDPRDVSDLAAVVPAGAVIFIDTLNRAAPTADENSSKDMGEILEGAKRLQRLTAGLVVLIHHTGKDTSKGLRGHSSLFAAMDACIEVSRDGDRREWKVAKSKDGADGDAHPFKLHIEALGSDEYGDPVTSCVVLRDTNAQAIQRVKVPQGGNQKLVYEGIRPLFKDGISGKPGAPPLRPCIDLEVAVAAGAGRLTCPGERRVTRARAAISSMVERGLLGLNEGWLWTA